MSEAKHTRDMVVFNEAVYQAQRACLLRSYARAIRRGTTIYGWTLGRAETEARLHESTVRNLADQSIRAALTKAAAAPEQQEQSK